MLISPLELSAQIKERADYLAYAPPSMLSEQVTDILRELARPQSIGEALNTLHIFQRLYLAHALDLADHAEIIAALNDAAHFPLWAQFVALPASDAQKDRLADLMYNGDTTKRAPILLVTSDYSRDIAERVVLHSVQAHEDMDVWVYDILFNRRLLLQCDAEKAATYGDIMAGRVENCERIISFSNQFSSVDFIDPVPAPEISQAYTDRYNLRHAPVRDKFFTATRLPTPQIAAIDEIPYEEYIDIFFAMCNVDYTQIDAAHRVLIAKLDAGHVLRITNGDGTDVTLDISGFTFVNSMVAKNVPGSEVFSAPFKQGVNGTIVAKGRFAPRENRDIIEDITLNFEDGKIISFDAASGLDLLRQMIETDEGSCYLGEIGIGTNPALRRHLTNSLMVEKIGGSFHVALGRCYKYTEYLGVPVKIDNGNVSRIHWDITTMLIGRQGKMMLDGAVIMQDGKFTDPALSYLNGTE